MIWLALWFCIGCYIHVVQWRASIIETTPTEWNNHPLPYIYAPTVILFWPLLLLWWVYWFLFMEN